MVKCPECDAVLELTENEEGISFFLCLSCGYESGYVGG